VPLGHCPFDRVQLELFESGLSLLEQHGDLPQGFGVDPEEWGPDGYPTTEEITVGLRKKIVSYLTSRWYLATSCGAMGTGILYYGSDIVSLKYTYIIH
jgi:hypothetical protein